MAKDKIIRVLVVDDSELFKDILVKKLSHDSSIRVVATASDPYEARDMIIMHRPDVVTLDIEMPRMSGIDFLKKLMPQYPMPIIVVSSLNHVVFDALNAGAVDFVSKPTESTGLDAFINELIVKIKIATTVSMRHLHIDQEKVNSVQRIKHNAGIKLIAIGASTGGTIAISQLLKGLPKDVPGIVIVQHMPPRFTKMFADRLNNECLLTVKEAQDGDRIVSGQVLIAAGNTHVRVVKRHFGYCIETERCTGCNKVNGHCPSVDVLFESVSKEVRTAAIGVILTGMGRDGALGLKKMKECGASTIAQDKESCVVYGMPKVAYQLGAVDYQLPLNAIADMIIKIIENNHV